MNDLKEFIEKSTKLGLSKDEIVSEISSYIFEKINKEYTDKKPNYTLVSVGFKNGIDSSDIAYSLSSVTENSFFMDESDIYDVEISKILNNEYGLDVEEIRKGIDKKYLSSILGDVYLINLNTSDNEIWINELLPILINNTHVTSINGISVDRINSIIKICDGFDYSRQNKYQILNEFFEIQNDSLLKSLAVEIDENGEFTYDKNGHKKITFNMPYSAEYKGIMFPFINDENSDNPLYIEMKKYGLEELIPNEIFLDRKDDYIYYREFLNDINKSVSEIAKFSKDFGEYIESDTSINLQVIKDINKNNESHYNKTVSIYDFMDNYPTLCTKFFRPKFEDKRPQFIMPKLGIEIDHREINYFLDKLNDLTGFIESLFGYGSDVAFNNLLSLMQEAKNKYGFETTEYNRIVFGEAGSASYKYYKFSGLAQEIGYYLTIASLFETGYIIAEDIYSGNEEAAVKEMRDWGTGTLVGLGLGSLTGESIIQFSLFVASKTNPVIGILVAAASVFLLTKFGKSLSDVISDGLGWLSDKFADWLVGSVGEATAARVSADPLILDLDGKGFKITYKKDGAHFDLNSDGFAEKINWTKSNGILTVDLNENGIVDDGREVFGDYHLLADGTRAHNGFEALAQYDSNEDGIIDSEDEIFDKLRVWVDSDGNGVSEKRELKSLEELGIKAIKLNYVTKNQNTDTEALIGNVSTYVREDGSEDSIGEMWVASDLFDTMERVVTGISGMVDGLPDVRSYGTISSLHSAIVNDESGKLKTLVEEFISLNESSDRIKKTEEILSYMCGADDIDDNSRGGIFSAKKLAVIERFMGEEFIGINGSNPNSAAAPILENVYHKLVEMYYMAIVGSGVSDLLNLMFVVEKDGKKRINADLLNFYMVLGIKYEIVTKDQLVDVCSYLNYYGSNFLNDLSTYNDIHEYISNNLPEYIDYLDNNVFGAIRGDENSNSLNGTMVADLIYGKEGNDSISSGRGNDLIYGGADNDTIHGDEGDDIIYGDEGDDYLDGGSGDDILIDSDGDDSFVFGRGYGHDEIRDEGGKNSIRFAGLSPRDISVNGINDFDVRITIKSTGETLTIKDFRKDETLADYTLIFDNVTMHCTDEKSPFRHIYGGNGDDVLKAAVPDSTMHAFDSDDTVIGSKGNDVIYSGTGKDTIEAGAGDDIVYGETGDDNIRGEAGRDVIYGGSGNDIISGGLDDDVLIGGEGNDTYIFGRGFGIDVIDDIEGESIIRLESGISADDINVYISGSEAVIAIKDAVGEDKESAVSTDRLVIKDYVGNEDKYSIVIAGETKNLSDMIIIPDAEEAAAVEDTSLITGTDDYNYVVSGEEAETILGDGHLDRILASFGDDTLFGGDGNDQLFGEEGRDFIFGNEGDEYINGGLDNDVISGGAGKDFIDGGEGDDVYIYNLGDGTDSIKDSEGLNRIVFGEGINPGTIKCYRSNWNDLMVTFDGTADNIIIKNYCISKEARNFELVFADGTVVDATDTESPLRTIYGTNGSEYMASIYEDGITMIGQDGYDEVHGGAGNDKLYGGAGDDRVIGEAGNDTLFGEAGRDYLAGGSGDDTYIYRAGDGIDTVSDSEGTNYISIEGYSISDVKAYRTNWNNLTIVFGGGNVNSDYKADGTMQDKLVIENFFVSDNSRNYYISYNGSGMIHAAAWNSPLRTIYSTNGNEYMLAMDDNGVTLIASDGYNTINGGAGSDRLYGGTGNDSILGNAGNDYIDGKTGNDTLLGGAGNDTYIFDVGYGIDRIVEDTGVNTIQFGAGIDKESITAERSENNDLKLFFGDTDDRLILTGYFAEDDRRKYDVSFADGERFGFEDEENPISLAYEDAAAIELQNQIDEFENAFEAEESAPISEDTDLQALKLVEDVAGFGSEGEISDGVTFVDESTTLLSDQIIITDSEI